MLLVVLVLFTISKNLCLAQNCIPVDKCPVAVKYLEQRRDDPETIKMLQKVHCGNEILGNSRKTKVNCDQIPAFDENCIYLTDCPAALELIDKHKYEKKTLDLLRSVACGYSEQQDMIYCNKIKPMNVSQRHADLLPSNDKCGIQNTALKIVNGKSTELDEFPWIALLKYKDSLNKMRYSCHGSLINEKYVLTAAHCLGSEAKTKSGVVYSVILGEYDIRNETDCILPQYGKDCNEPVQEILVASNYSHPDFAKNTNRFGNDIGLIRLKTSARYSNFVQPICLPLGSFFVKDFEPLLVAGWGKTKTKLMSEVKLKTTVYYLNRQECISRLSLITDNSQICAGSNDTSDSCNGDSGGPLMALKKENGDFKAYVVGIVSFGIKCGETASIYSNTSAFIDWILETIQP